MFAVWHMFAPVVSRLNVNAASRPVVPVANATSGNRATMFPQARSDFVSRKHSCAQDYFLPHVLMSTSA
jgi:hypothetical protein